MINRKRLLCTVLSCMVNPLSANVFASDIPIPDVLDQKDIKEDNANDLLKNMNAEEILSSSNSDLNVLDKATSEDSAKEDNSVKVEVTEISPSSNSNIVEPSAIEKSISKNGNNGSAKEIISKKSSYNKKAASIGELTKEDRKEITSYFLRQIDKAFDNLVFLPESNYLVLPLCDGHWATNAFCNPKIIKEPDFTRGLVMDMMLAVCMYHLNIVHSMTPEQRKENMNSLSMKIVRWLSDNHLPNGSQDSYDFWNVNNVKIFNLCQWNACQKSYHLMSAYLKRFETINGISSQHMLDSLYENNGTATKDKKDVKESTKKDTVYEQDIKEINNYFLGQIEKAFDHLVFLPESNYLVLPLCDGNWATNAFCSPEAVQDPNFVRGLVMDMTLAICMYHLNKVHTMTPEQRNENWDTISVKIVRWLNDGHLPEGSQTSYSFWNANNAKIFNTCQWNACQKSYNLMTKYFKEFEKTNGNGSADYMLDMLYEN